MVDSLGNPVHILLSGGQVHDSKIAIDILSGIDISGSNILGYKAYGTEKIRTCITEHNADYTISPRGNNPDSWFCDFWLYKERHLVECIFNKIKAFRRVATHYDKLASPFLAFVYITSIASIWFLSK